MSSTKKSYRRLLCLLLTAVMLFAAVFYLQTAYDSIPDSIHMFVNQDTNLKVAAGLGLSRNDAVSMSENGQEVVLASAQTGNYTMDVKLFGFLPVKSVSVSVVEETELIPCGIPIGIYLKTDGVLVIGTSSVTRMDGALIEPSYGIVQAGDYIVSYNGTQVSSKSQLSYLVEESGREDAKLQIRRNGELLDVKIKPVETEPGRYQLGVWVRDDTQGIGTLTYIDSSGNFGALGHGISDVDTGELLSSEEGVLYAANVWGIKKGENGNPGGLCGNIRYQEDNVLGAIEANTGQGIFGKCNEKMQHMYTGKPMQIGWKQEVETGKASILCQVDGTLKEYEIEIEEVNMNDRNLNHGMVLHVTDPELLELTNGIVQGMSGSPILQNGKIIGAVTHVFVNDPSRGYGIFIEHMLSR